MRRNQVTWKRWMGASLVLGAVGCVAVDGGEGTEEPGGPGNEQPGDKPRSDVDLRSSKTGLQKADDCPDLLTKIQEDAIAKLDLVVAQYEENLDDYLENPSQGLPGGGIVGGIAGGTFGGGFLGGVSGPVVGPGGGVTGGGGGAFIGGAASVGGLSGVAGGVAGGTIGGSNAGAPLPPTLTPTTPGQGTGGTGGVGGASEDTGGKDPIGASETNTQVAGVDEADFVKLVENGKGMFLLHGNSLRKLKTFPAEELSLEGGELKIEGSPSELFVTDDGKAVVFSSTWGYGHPPSAAMRAANYCTPSWCGGGDSYTKITVADVSGATPRTLRELYYRGNYVSSRRYDDVVRVVLQSYSTHSGLYSPDLEWTDAWGRYYEAEEITEQLAQWRERTADSIRDTELTDWLPVVQEVKDGQLVDVEPACGSYYVPQPGISDYGLTHVLSIDVAKEAAPVGGVTVIGQASTVYSNAERLVLAQPDYRWLSGGIGRGFFIDEQRTTLHMFGLDADQTAYLASGWVAGQLPPHNPQFAIDVAGDHTLRIATTGSARKNPEAEPDDLDFWETTQQNRVFTLRAQGEELTVVGRSENLGHVENGETTQSARFVGDRGYVVTFRQKDPLIVLDVGDAEHPSVLGEIEIPGFSQYMHPLDEDHLITFGQSGNGGVQLQLFDVSDPKNLPQPKVLDLGYTWSEVSNNHKAFTYYAEQKLIALPVSGNFFVSEMGYYRPMAGLKVVTVDVESGFELLGSIDHTGIYQEQKCIVCDSFTGGSCYVPCGAPVEVRRGHFVQGTDATYVYAISYGGVSVSDIDALSKPIKTVVLPQPVYDNSIWHGTSGGGITGGGFVGGGLTGGGFTGGASGGITPGVGTTPASPPPSMQPAVDAGVAEQDGGSDSKL